MLIIIVVYHRLHVDDPKKTPNRMFITL